MLISEKYNTRIWKYICRELVVTLERMANMLMHACGRRQQYVMGADVINLLVCYVHRHSGQCKTFNGFTCILVKEGHGHTLLYL